jgi:PAS domain S-box-containing protein
VVNSSSILEAVLQAEDDAITVIDRDKRVLYWNDAAVRTFGVAKETIINKNITDHFQEEDLMILRVLKTKKAVRNIYHRPRKDLHVVINTSPIFNEKNELIGAISVERDITQLVRLNDNLETASEELHELRRQVSETREASPFKKLEGKSQVLHHTIRIAKKAAMTDATTLILGESGTGKEICARAIHEASTRSKEAFIPVNCGAIPEALFESEFFGYEPGAFTGAASEGKKGKVEMANGGTLFLDEIGELPFDMQVKLLRVLQEQRVYRIGDSTGLDVDVRIIAATNQDLAGMMAENKFRSDLYYRLNVIQLTMPPLRERREDIPALAQLFLKQFAKEYQSPVPEIDPTAIPVLLTYDWPGNVRELKNIMERIVILSEKSILSESDLLALLPDSTTYPAQKTDTDTTLPGEKEAVEKMLIEDTLLKTNGNKSDAARRLGISRVTLYSRLKKYGIK